MTAKSRRVALPADLGRRERQILDTVYRRGRASVAEVRDELPDPPSYSAVRGMLNLLKDKGHLRTETDGLRSSPARRPTPRPRCSSCPTASCRATSWHSSRVS
jgi:hypothetical protein